MHRPSFVLVSEDASGDVREPRIARREELKKKSPYERPSSNNPTPRASIARASRRVDQTNLGRWFRGHVLVRVGQNRRLHDLADPFLARVRGNVPESLHQRVTIQEGHSTGEPRDLAFEKSDAIHHDPATMI